MARIRSIHPGIWTDEDFARISMAARILFLGILTEADDHGIFEWKPISLKMRIFPADNLDVEPLLSELIGAGKVACEEIEGREYGAVRNFCKFQRPKKPTYRFPLSPGAEGWVGLPTANSPPVPHPSGTGTEKSSQMEEEGGKREEERKKEDVGASAPPTPDDLKIAFESGAVRLTNRDFSRWKSLFTHLDLGAELESLAPWANEQKANGGNWFHAVSGALAKRNREIGIRIEQAKKNGTDPHDWRNAIL